MSPHAVCARACTRSQRPALGLTYPSHSTACVSIIKKTTKQDIENVRMEKIRRGMQGMSDTVLRGRSVMSTKVKG